MRTILLAGAALLSFTSAALGAPAEGPSRRFEAKDLFALEQAQDPQVRPDGLAVAYVRSSEDIMSDGARRSIWLVDVNSGAQTPLVDGTGAAFEPRWSPDGGRLAYVSTAGGKPQLYVRWMATGATASIADLPQAPSNLTWSPDGRSIAFSMLTEDDPAKLGSPVPKPEGARWADPLVVIDAVTYRADGEGYLKPGFSHIYVVSADGGAPRQLTFGAFNERGELAWTPDGRSLILSANRTKDWALQPEESDLFQLSLADGALTQLTHRVGPNREPQVSPKGDRIAYTGFDERHRGYENVKLYVMDRDGGHAHAITEGLDRSVESPRWAADGKSLFVLYVDHGVGKVARVTLDGHVQDLAAGMSGAEPDRPYTGGQYTVSGNGVIAFTQGGPLEPGDVAVVKGGAVRRLTHLDDDLFMGKSLGQVSPLKVSSSVDGKPIDAWTITPPDFDPGKKYPLILEIHGGPYASYGPVFASELQLYAAAGYVVVYANPRGSTSYGFDFADQINYNYPSHDYDDLMSAVDAAIAKGFVDPNNLFVTGGSGGGLLTAWIVGNTGRFKAAVSQKPVINWTSEVLTVDFYVDQAQNWFGKNPWEDQANYWRRSPLSLVGKVTTPTLLMVGSEDRRTPSSEAEQFYQALKLRGVPTAMVRVPGASHHGLAERPSQEAAEASAILAWFARYRTPGP
ncbi:MAG TPA: S9 family peptidase [Caulobacteraceae bacterium]|nr:S9 family peptidase [Caulobacteraceae bacterium]